MMTSLTGSSKAIINETLSTINHLTTLIMILNYTTRPLFSRLPDLIKKNNKKIISQVFTG